MPIKVNKSALEVFVLVMLATVMNFGFMPLLLFLVCFFFIAIKRKFKFLISIDQIVIVLVFILVMLGSLLYYGHKVTEKLYIASIIYAVLALGVSGLLCTFNKKAIEEGVRYAIITIIFLLVFQQVYYIVLGDYFDVHWALTVGKYTSRYESEFIQGFGLIRGTAFSIEPSNCAAILTYLIVIYTFSKNKFDLFSVVAICATAITFSFASIAISIAILTLFSFTVIFSKLTIKSIIITFLLAVLVVFGLMFFLERMFGGVGYDAAGARLFIFEFLGSQNGLSHVFGHGVLAFEQPFDIDGFELTNSHIRDSGFWVNLYFSSGVIGVLAFFILLYRKSSSLIFVMLFMVTFLYKFDYMQPMFWLYLFMICSISKKIYLNDPINIKGQK